MGSAQELGGGRWAWRDPRAAGSVNGRGAGETLCSLLKNEQQKQRQVHVNAEDGAGEVLATGSVGTSEEKDSGESEAPPVDASEREGDV